MYKKLAVILTITMLMMVAFGTVYSDDKATTKKSATCTLHKDGKCPSDCCTNQNECKSKSADCQKVHDAKKSACKESACKSTCPAHSNCKSIEGKKK